MNQPEFDVFLAHNSLDKPQVRALANELRWRGLNPWLDEEQIRPGSSFQQEIQQAIPLVKSAAIFLGARGLGAWQSWELRALISQCVKRNIPVIPVLLPGVNQLPEDLIFLKEFRWVCFSQSIDDESVLSLLEWGITGIKPQPQNISNQKPVIQTPETPSIIVEPLTEQVFLFDVIKVSASGQEVKRAQSKAQYFTEDLGNGVSLEMVSIPGGSFKMGSPLGEKSRSSDESPQHDVNVPAFFMGRFEVTQEQYQQVISCPVKDLS